MGFDLIFTEPPTSRSRSFCHSSRNKSDVFSELERGSVAYFADFEKRRVIRGGYVIIIIPFVGYIEWYDALYAASMEIMPHPYIIMFDSSTVQHLNTDMFPENPCQFAMVVHQQSAAKRKDCSRLNTNFNSISCSSSRNLVGMFNVPIPKSKLYRQKSNVHFWTNEQYADMLGYTRRYWLRPIRRKIDEINRFRPNRP